MPLIISTAPPFWLATAGRTSVIFTSNFDPSDLTVISEEHRTASELLPVKCDVNMVLRKLLHLHIERRHLAGHLALPLVHPRHTDPIFLLLVTYSHVERVNDLALLSALETCLRIVLAPLN